jgi:hypothetical protein
MEVSGYFGEKKYKQIAVEAATDLGYGDLVIERINRAKSEAEIERIMVTARKQKFDIDI